MNFDIIEWVEALKAKIKETYKEKVVFIGFQGSYARGEANKNSDIDIVVILEELSIDDLDLYKNIIQSMPYSEKACGFISGKNEIVQWSKSEVFQLLNDTTPLLGDLNEIVGPISLEDAKDAYKMGVQNLYHGAVHTYLYDKDLSQNIAGLFKSTFFILQAKYFVLLGKYFHTKNALLKNLEEKDREILEIAIDKEKFKGMDNEGLKNCYKILINWCKDQFFLFSC